MRAGPGPKRGDVGVIRVLHRPQLHGADERPLVVVPLDLAAGLNRHRDEVLVLYRRHRRVEVREFVQPHPEGAEVLRGGNAAPVAVAQEHDPALPHQRRQGRPRQCHPAEDVGGADADGQIRTPIGAPTGRIRMNELDVLGVHGVGEHPTGVVHAGARAAEQLHDETEGLALPASQIHGVRAGRQRQLFQQGDEPGVIDRRAQSTVAMGEIRPSVPRVGIHAEILPDE